MEAETYQVMALKVIEIARSPDELREWWKDEAQHRKDYGLSEEQVATLVQACKVKTEAMLHATVKKSRKKKRLI